MRFNKPGPRCRNRALEWITATILLVFALEALITPTTIEKGAFKYMVVLGVTSAIFMWTCLLVGMSRYVALYYNGRGLPWTARVRAVGAVIGAIIFSFMALSLAYLTTDTGTLSLGIGTHAILACAEIYSCLRAGADASSGFYCPYNLDGD